MSKLVALRIPDDLLERIDCIEGSRSGVIIGILQASLIRGHGTPVSDVEVQSKRIVTPTITPATRKARQVAASIPTASRYRLPTPQARHQLPLLHVPPTDQRLIPPQQRAAPVVALHPW
jgi:hypothetical protein